MSSEGSKNWLSRILGICVVLGILGFLVAKGLPFKHLRHDSFNHKEYKYEMYCISYY